MYPPWGGKALYFNPLSPHGERPAGTPIPGSGLSFQSTLPTRGETHIAHLRGFREIFQSTLPTRGETANGARPRGSARISIHSPHTGRDLCGLSEESETQKFQSTLPTRGETAFGEERLQRLAISIHSPHTGRDLAAFVPKANYHCDFNPLSPHGERLPPGGLFFVRAGDFNPLSPHGERRAIPGTPSLWRSFQSTLPTRGETP